MSALRPVSAAPRGAGVAAAGAALAAGAAALGAGAGFAAGAGAATAGAGADFAAPASALSIVATTEPSDSSSPTLTLISLIVPANGAGTSIVALSDSSVTRP